MTQRHILLVGLPGSGKTTLGRLVAQGLGAGFIDSDQILVRKMQMPIARIFAEHGEPKFRELEREVMDGALSGPPSVMAPGGGWVAQPGRLEQAKSSCLILYIKVMVLTAVKRVGSDTTRPLLLTDDPVERMRTLLQEREPFFGQADAEIKNDMKTADQAAGEIVALARERAGW